jgi:hypothetical protein
MRHFLREDLWFTNDKHTNWPGNAGEEVWVEGTRTLMLTLSCPGRLSKAPEPFALELPISNVATDFGPIAEKFGTYKMAQIRLADGRQFVVPRSKVLSVRDVRGLHQIVGGGLEHGGNYQFRRVSDGRVSKESYRLWGLKDPIPRDVEDDNLALISGWTHAVPHGLLRSSPPGLVRELKTRSKYGPVYKRLA